MRVVITGITSPLARRAAIFLRDRGYDVLGFSRNLGEPIEGVEMKTGDICNRKSLIPLMKGCSAVIHCAALSSPFGREEDFYAINVEGTQNVLDAAMHFDVSRFIHVSTPSLYYNFEDRLNLSESSAFASKFANSYVRTKFLAEKAVDHSFDEGLHTVTIRPRGVFGPGDRVLLPRLLKALDKGGIPRFRKEATYVDVTYVDNVAESLVLALEKGEAGQKYNITNGEPWEISDLFSKLTQAVGRKGGLKKVSYPLARFAAKVQEKFAHLTGKEPLFTPYVIGVLTHSQTFNIDFAQKQLGYYPKISIEEGIERYGRWWRENI